MKTFKQTVSESAAGDELYDIKLRLGEWWKGNSKMPEFKKDKAKLGKIFDEVFRKLDEVVDIVYEAEPEIKK